MMWCLAQNAVGAAVLAVAVGVVTRSVRLRPSVAHALWLMVILKLIAPPLPVWSWPTTVGNAPTAVSPLLALANPLDAPQPWSAMVWSVATSLWVAGAAGMALLQGVRLCRVHAAIRGGDASPEWMATETRELAARLQVRIPRTIVVRGGGSPLLVNVIRPVLALPEPLLRTLDRAAWRGVLAHELIHLKRRDHWVGWIEFLAACMWWWNPIFWYARRRMRESAEYACDAWVVRLFPEGRRLYAESLITVADSMSWNSVPVGAIGMASGAKRTLERRLHMILRDAVPHRMSRMAVASAILVTLVILPGWAQPKPAVTESIAHAVMSNTVPTEPAPAIVSAATAQPVARLASNFIPSASFVEQAGTTQVPVTAAPTPRPKPQAKARRSASAVSKQIAGATSAQSTATSVAAQDKPEITTPEPTPDTVKQTPKVRYAETTPTRAERSALTYNGSDGAVTREAASASTGLQKIEVHGEMRIRFNRYSVH